MFTGIIQDLGKIVEIQETPEGKSIWISSELDPKHFTIGNSISVNGVCLTVEEYKDKRFRVTAVHESLKVSTLGGTNENEQVNIETPLTLETPIAGHLVSGHVDGIGQVIQAGSDYWLKVPQNLMKYIAKKGSITINGVSLTVAEVKGQEIRIALIPETIKQTNLNKVKEVNLEIDLIARYLESLTQNK